MCLWRSVKGRGLATAIVLVADPSLNILPPLRHQGRDRTNVAVPGKWHGEIGKTEAKNATEGRIRSCKGCPKEWQGLPHKITAKDRRWGGNEEGKQGEKWLDGRNRKKYKEKQFPRPQKWWKYQRHVMQRECDLSLLFRSCLRCLSCSWSR